MSYPIIFFGTPDFAAAHLQALVKCKDFEVCRVVSQPDRPAGRKMKLQASPVKTLAHDLGLPVLTPASAKDRDFLSELRSAQAHAAVVVAYGQILSQELLDIFEGRVVNIHGSLLPRWRGAAPIQRALMAGDAETGVTLQLVEKRLDAGDILGSRHLVLADNLDALDVLESMKPLGAELLRNEFLAYLKGQICPVVQDEAAVTYASKIDKSEAWVDWKLPARQIFNHYRGLKMGPGSRTRLGQLEVKLLEIEVQSDESDLGAGQVLATSPKGIFVGTSKGSIKISKLQPASKASMSVEAFLLGYSVQKGDHFG